MISVEQFEDDYCLWKRSIGPQLSMSCCVLLRGIKVPLYRFGHGSAKGSSAYRGSSCTAEQEQSLLDSLLLAQWEEHSWKGLLRYDVTTCETKVISRRRKFIAQLNEGWDLDYCTESGGNILLEPLGPSEFNCMKTNKEELLFCVTNGEKTNAELIPSALVPNDAVLVIVNENPVEYGHVFLVSYPPYHQPQYLPARFLEMVVRVSVEINNCSFRAFCDCPTDSSSNHVYFQGCYFANPLPVEVMPVVPIFGQWEEKGMHIYEIADYPIKLVVFKGKDNLKALSGVLSEICSCLRNQNTPFNLLISDCGTKIFLFPQVHASVDLHNISAWECGGHFIFKSRLDFDRATEEDMVKRLAAVSLNDEAFQAVKQICCSIAGKIVS